MLKIRQIRNKKLSGEVVLPVSKSIANRCLIIEALAGQKNTVSDRNGSQDVTLLHKALFSGVNYIDFQDAGTPLRFFIAYASLMGLDTVIDGGERLKSRPISPLISALEHLGVEFEYMEEKGSLPLKIKMAVDRNISRVHLKTELSSQFLSALMLIAPYFNHGLIIETEGPLFSGPYVRLTIEIMSESGIEVEIQNNTYMIKNGKYQLNENYIIESDWSAATFIYALAVMADDVNILMSGLQLDSSQGDMATIKIFEQFGVISEHEEGGIRIRKTRIKTDFIEVDFTLIPDMFPAVSAICAALRIKARFTGTKNLAFKESDRVKAMKINLQQTGTVFKMIGDNEIKLGYSNAVSGKYTFKSFDDHRIAMACSIFAFQNDISIDDETVVKKSFPDYWVEFRRLTFSSLSEF